MSSEAEARLLLDYRPPFLAYLAHQDEAGLRAAYELGRQAVGRHVGLLGLVRIHNQVFLEVIDTVRTPDAARETAQDASSFLFEALAPFEMTHRAFPGRGAARSR